ncbi:ITPKA [Cordylochernes scorpioides]|uniref:Kinase n=1 Tax=Cordylochernes scorpioides TaxID=51811 RepID=A0ABY6L0Z5_9ARAC|nr:ITPKA [Cordylochernes scorpioides]
MLTENSAGNFKSGSHGTILKKLGGREDICLAELMQEDELKTFVPKYYGSVSIDNNIYLELQDLLADFSCPCIMDVKMGVRTYLEDELARARENPKLRKDMYEKMIQIDPAAPTEEEHRLHAVTKPRYMVWRETISSTAALGFRIEGLKLADGSSTKDFKTTKEWDEVLEIMTKFLDGFPGTAEKYYQRLKSLRQALVTSRFFKMHEVRFEIQNGDLEFDGRRLFQMIGSSLLFVHDHNSASVWMIDFAKTFPVKTPLDHNVDWSLGNHEDGYLQGLNNLMRIFQQLANHNME